MTRNPTTLLLGIAVCILGVAHMNLSSAARKRIEAIERHAPNIAGSNIVARLAVLEAVAFRLPTNVVVLDDGAIFEPATMRTFPNAAEYVRSLLTNATVTFTNDAVGPHTVRWPVTNSPSGAASRSTP